jgi:hypothetical protein
MLKIDVCMQCWKVAGILRMLHLDLLKSCTIFPVTNIRG